MPANDSANSPALGLDIGTSRICLAQRSGEDFHYQTQLNAFVTVPFSKMTESVLKREKVPHTIRGSEIIVHGNESDRLADLLNVETRRTMAKGILNPAEPDSLEMIRKIISSMIEPAKAKQKLFFTVPAAPTGSGDSLTYHETTLRQILNEMGYDARSIPEGLAVIYGELDSSNYTGIGVSCGGGLCNVCLSYLSVPVLSFSIPKAGDYIDASAAAITGDRVNRVRMEKEDSFHFNGFSPGKLHQVLAVYYDEMIQSIIAAMKQSLASGRNLPKVGKPIPVVLSGGTALPQGFRDRFEKVLRDSEFPLPVSEIRMATEPLHTTAKGALVAALTDLG